MPTESTLGPGRQFCPSYLWAHETRAALQALEPPGLLLSHGGPGAKTQSLYLCPSLQKAAAHAPQHTFLCSLPACGDFCSFPLLGINCRQPKAPTWLFHILSRNTLQWTHWSITGPGRAKSSLLIWRTLLSKETKPPPHPWLAPEADLKISPIQKLPR